MSMVWLSAAFNHYLISFLLTSFEKVYLSTVTSSLGEMSAYVLGGVIYKKIGLKLSLSVSFAFAAFGGLLLLFYGLQHQDSAMFPLFIIIAQLGVSASFNIVYISNSEVFPVLFCASALGICNFFSRVIASLAPIVSTVD